MQKVQNYFEYFVQFCIQPGRIESSMVGLVQESIYPHQRILRYQCFLLQSHKLAPEHKWIRQWTDSDNCTWCSTQAWSARPVMRSSFLTQLLPSALKENTVLYQIRILKRFGPIIYLYLTFLSFPT